MSDMIKSVKQIFTDQVFFIPDYQRGYAWEVDQCQDLLDDLELISANGRHYTGTLVVAPHEGEQKSFVDINLLEYQAFDIIDGQQRLTTIIILLRAILDELHDLPDLPQGLAENLRQTYLYHTDRARQPFPKLTPGADSQDFFSRQILALRPGIVEPTIRSHQRLQDAQVHFVTYLTAKRQSLQDAYPDWLQTFYGKIINQLKFIFYPVTDDLDAGIIFETMNDRGKPLTELEKVKNHLLYLSAKLDVPDAHAQLRRRVNETWKYIYERLMFAGLAGRANEDQLLRAHWLMAYNYDAAQWESARSVKTRFNLKSYSGRHAQLLDDVLVYLDTLRDAASAYCDIYAPGKDGAFRNIPDPEQRKQIVLWSEKLARQGVRAAYLPILIALRLKADAPAYLRITKLLERFTFRVFTIAESRRSNTGQPILFRLGNNLYKNGNVDWLWEEIAQALVIYSPHADFEKAFDREKMNWYEWGGINYFLYEYEHHLAGGRQVAWTWEVLNGKTRTTSTEHILPQNPSDQAWLERFPPELRQRWTNDFANLTLTFDNSSLGNRNFVTKKGAPGKKGTYSDSPLFIEKEIAAFDDWNETALQTRRAALKAWALQRWAVDVKPRQDPTGKTVEAIIAHAEEFGLGEELQAIHEALGRLQMWPSIQKNLKYCKSPHYRQTLVLVEVRPTGFVVSFRPDKFVSYRGVTPDEAHALIGLRSGWNWLNPGEDVRRFLDGLQRFEKLIEERNPR